MSVFHRVSSFTLESLLHHFFVEDFIASFLLLLLEINESIRKLYLFYTKIPF